MTICHRVLYLFFTFDRTEGTFLFLAGIHTQMIFCAWFHWVISTEVNPRWPSLFSTHIPSAA